MAEEEQTFINRILIDASDTLDKIQLMAIAAQEYRKELDKLKADLIKVAALSGENFKAAAEGYKLIMNQLAQTGALDTGMVSQAIQELRQEQTTAARQIIEIQKQIGVEAKSGMDKASEAAEKYRGRINAVKQAIVELANQQRISLQDAARGLVEAGQVSSRDATKALSELSRQSGATGKALMSMGNIAKFVFGTILGVTAVGILRNLIGWLKQAAESGYEFTKAVFQLSIGVRALQRSGIEITIKDVYENIDKLRDRFKIFTRKELVVGSAAFLNLIRDMGFTKDQIFALQNAIATLAVVNGRAMDEVQRTVALALSSGYTEGLQRLGVSINRVTIAMKANELGWKGGYMALTEQQRAYATQILVLEKTAKYEEDLLEYYKTLPGQIDNTTRAIKDETVAIGEMLVPTKLLWEQLKLGTLWGVEMTPFISWILNLSKAIQIIDRAVKIWYDDLVKIRAELAKHSKIVAWFAQIFPAVGEAEKDAAKEADGFFDKWWKGLEKTNPKLHQFLEDANKIFRGEFVDTLGDVAVKEADEFAAVMEKMGEVAEKAIDQIDDELSRLDESIRDAWIDLKNDLSKLARDLARDLNEAFSDFQRDLFDIDVDTRRDMEDEIVRYAGEVIKVTDDANKERAKKEQNYRDKELEAERKFQERMRQLRENFLLDLEDAVRERDALQIVRLTRRYNLEKKQAEREEQIRKEFAARDQRRELQDLEDKRRARLRDLAIEHEERKNAIALNRQREREDALLAYERERQDLLDKYKKDKFERELRYVEDINRLDLHFKDRLKKIVDGLAAEFELNKTNLQALEQLLKAYYGPDGSYEIIINEFYARLAEKTPTGSKIITEGKTQGKDRPKPRFDEEVPANKTSKLTQDEIDEENRIVESGLEDQNQIRRTKAEDQADDLELAKDERSIIVSEGMDEEYRLIEEKSNLIVELLNRYFGPGGAVDVIYQGLLARVISIFNTIIAYITALSGIRIGTSRTTPNPSPGGGGGGGGAVAFAEGGTLIATKPTQAVFGETPEIVTFQPLNRRGANIERTYGSAPAGMKVSGNGGGKGVIEVRLSEGLEASIIDNALGEFAEIVISTQKRRI